MLCSPVQFPVPHTLPPSHSHHVQGRVHDMLFWCQLFGGALSLPSSDVRPPASGMSHHRVALHTGDSSLRDEWYGILIAGECVSQAKINGKTVRDCVKVFSRVPRTLLKVAPCMVRFSQLVNIDALLLPPATEAQCRRDKEEQQVSTHSGFLALDLVTVARTRWLGVWPAGIR